MAAREWLIERTARALARVPSRPFRRAVLAETFASDPQALLEALGPTLVLSRTLATAPVDLDPAGAVAFEDLAGLFSSTSLNHGVIAMTIRQAAYLFGFARRSGARTAIEVGRWRGGTTIVLAAAMGPDARIWSIDSGDKEAHLFGRKPELFDRETRAFCERFGLQAELVVGDSRTLELATGEVDIVFVDGDHSYEGAQTDFERWGRRVRVGGAVFFDDAFDEEHFPSSADTVGRVVHEAAESGDFVLRKVVDRLAHLERVR